jgi:uncharacterized tellurite resistance protein B-like protein
MELRELSPEEDVVLVGLLREVSSADGRYTEPEKRHIERVCAALGAARFDAAVAKARELFKSRDAVKAAAKSITRKDARVVIYDTLDAMASSDGRTAEEEKPLAWLASWWDLAKKQ